MFRPTTLCLALFAAAAGCSGGSTIENLGTVNQTAFTSCCDPGAAFPQAAATVTVDVSGGSPFSSRTDLAILDVSGPLSFEVQGEPFDPSTDVLGGADTGPAVRIDVFFASCPEPGTASGFTIRLTAITEGEELSGLGALEFEEERITITCDQEPPDEPPPGGGDERIAFATDRDGNWEVYVMEPDGGGARNVTQHAADDRDPAWSPDRTRIAFLSNRDAPGFSPDSLDLYVMNADGSGAATRLTQFAADGGSVDDPQWTPDGTQIACVGGFGAGNPMQLMLVDAATGDPTQLVGGEGTLRSPSVSPAGDEIVYTLNGLLAVYDLPADAFAQPFTVGQLPFAFEHVQWNPAGGGQPWLFASINFDEDLPRLHRIAGDASFTQITFGTGDTANDPTDRRPSWSPDGARIAFTRRASGGTGPARIWIVGANGAGAGEVPAQTGENEDPDW